MFVNEYLSQTRVIMNTITTYIAISIILNYMPVIVKGANRQLSNNLWNCSEVAETNTGTRMLYGT